MGPTSGLGFGGRTHELLRIVELERSLSTVVLNGLGALSMVATERALSMDEQDMLVLLVVEQERTPSTTRLKRRLLQRRRSTTSSALSGPPPSHGSRGGLRRWNFYGRRCGEWSRSWSGSRRIGWRRWMFVGRT